MNPGQAGRDRRARAPGRDRGRPTVRQPPLAALAKPHPRFALGPPLDRVRDGPGGWWIWHEPELHFGDDVLVPDVTGWRRERMCGTT